MKRAAANYPDSKREQHNRSDLLCDDHPVMLFTNSFLMGGMEEHVLQVARELALRGRRVGVICSDIEAIAQLRTDLKSAGVAVYALHDHPRGPRGVLDRFTDLRAALRAHGARVLHLHLTGFRGGELLLIAAHLEGIHAIVRTEHLPPIGPQSAPTRILARVRDRFVQKVICVSDENRAEHIRLLGRSAERITVVPNCVDIERFRPDADGATVRAELGIGEGVPLVGVVGRLSERRKGTHLFLDMAALVHAARPDARFAIVGDGCLRADLEEQARTLGIDAAVHFAGERHDIPRVLAALDVFVLPSLFEGAPYAALEALAAGRPTVAARVASIDQLIVHGESGFVVPIGDTRAMAECVIRLLEDPMMARRFGAVGRQTIESHYSLPAMIDGLCRVYAAAS